mgnify:CR=1 FL=1
MVTPAWREEVARAGRDPDVVQADLARIEAGTPPLDVVRPCVVGDGVARLAADALDPLEASGRAVAAGAIAFVPASGAATRLFAAWRRAEQGEPVPAARLDEAPQLAAWEGAATDTRAEGLRRTLTRWADAPKGLVPFHLPRRTAVDEHLAEAEAMGLAAVHFTVGATHHEAFRAAVSGAAVEVDLSEQDPRTDTVAFTPSGEPLRDERGLVFRPSGHGALVGNLSRAAERAPRGLVVVKNIDNVVAGVHRHRVLPWRLRLLGRAAQLRDAQHEILQTADAEAARTLLAQAFGLDVSTDEALHELDRPLRVAGVVRDDGEPGGGPYWVRDRDGRVRAQIVEGAQLSDRPAHERARSAATHFNPVDMALSVHGPAGPYALASFVDPDGTMIVRKSHRGRPLLAVERPGLWNGGMGRWNTAFVELPAFVFQPVKTMADLLRPLHRDLPLE